MIDKNNTAQAAEQDPLSDQFVNAVIRQHGYDSPEAVIARLWQWIGLNGSENGVTLLMYEAHKALSKLRAPVSDIREGFELTYAADADDPACASDLSHFTNGWRACIMFGARAPVADERAALADLLEYVDRNTCTHEDTHRGGAIWTICNGCGMKWADDEGGFVPHQDAPAVAAARAALASAPVAGMQPLEPEFAKVLSDNFDSLMVRIPSESAPVAGEAQIIGYVPSLYLEMRRRGMPVNSKIQHSPGDDATAPLYAASQARPSDDELWDQTLTERDEYHDMADKLADAIADHLLVEIGEHSSSNCPWMRALDAIQNAAPQASEAVREVAGVTLDGCLETLFRVGEHLGINYAESRKQPGAPSGVYIKAIEGRVSQARDTALEEAAKLMDQTSRSTGATLIRAALSAQPDAEPLSNPKQFTLTAADERTAFEATYQADYDDPGAACEREHFGKGFRAGILATRHHDDSQNAAEPEPKRFVILKESGSRFAYVNDTELGRTVKRFDVLKGDGWGKAERLATRLNAQHDSAGLAAQSVADKLERDYAAGKWPPPAGTYEVERTVNLAHPKQHNDGGQNA